MKVSTFCKIIPSFFFITEPQTNYVESKDDFDFTKICEPVRNNNSHELNLQFSNKNNQKSTVTFRKESGFMQQELTLIGIIINKINLFLELEIKTGLPLQLESLLPTFQQSAIATFLSRYKPDEEKPKKIKETELPSFQPEQIILRILNKYSDWASQTYEGSRISYSIGIDLTDLSWLHPTEEEISIDNYFDEDYFKVLTTGHDTLLECDTNGSILRHSELQNSSEMQNPNSPIQFAFFAQWATYPKCVITLTNQGEILIFYNKQLFFAKRRNQWMFFPHSQYRGKLFIEAQKKELHAVAQAVYESTLDLSFRKTGGCIGIVKNISNIEECINEENRLKNTQSSKQKLYTKLIDGKKFHALPRKLRLELLSLDGATVIQTDGTILAIGSILNIEQTKECHGGRTAAAIALSANKNLGVKISNDGKITIYKNSKIEIEYA